MSSVAVNRNCGCGTQTERFVVLSCVPVRRYGTYSYLKVLVLIKIVSPTREVNSNCGIQSGMELNWIR